MNKRLSESITRITKGQDSWVEFIKTKCKVSPLKIEQAIHDKTQLTEKELYSLWYGSDYQYSLNELLTSCGYKSTNTFVKGEIYWYDFGVTMGSIQGGIRPVVIVSNNINNKYSPTVQIAPITSQIKKPYPHHVRVEGHGLDKSSVVLTEQIKVVNKTELGDFIGFFNEQIISKIDEAISIQFGIHQKSNSEDITSVVLKCFSEFIEEFVPKQKLKNPEKFRSVLLREFNQFCKNSA